jgi:hypothetical protein
MSANDLVAKIVAETERRRQVWEQMQLVATQAVEAVDAEAKRRGISGRQWLQQACDGSGTISIVYSAHLLRLAASGHLHIGPQEATREMVYGGYSNFTTGDLPAFSERVVNELMIILNRYTMDRH